MSIQLFHPRKFQPLKCRLSWRISSRKKRLWRLPFWNFLSSQTMFMWHHSVWLEIGKKEKNLQLTLHPPQGLNLFFQVIIHFTIFNAIISEFRACLAQNNFIIAWEQLGSSEAIWTKSLAMDEWRHKNTPWLLSIVQNGNNDVQKMVKMKNDNNDVFFGDEFCKEKLYLRGWILGEWVNLNKNAKIYIFGVTFSFKVVQINTTITYTKEFYCINPIRIVKLQTEILLISLKVIGFVPLLDSGQVN